MNTDGGGFLERALKALFWVPPSSEPLEKCAVCQLARLPKDLNEYVARRYELESDGHSDYSILYCGDNSSCAEDVTVIPDIWKAP